MNKINVGITGQAGFIGTHLTNYLVLKQDEIQLIPFKDDFFKTPEKLKSFVKQCDTIIHLAAMNRHNSPEIIYKTNLRLVNQLLHALDDTNSTPHIIFSSSTQEGCNNLYGKSKKEGRKLFMKWAQKNNAKFTGLIIPNVFGPFCTPFYNSVIATFCYQITHHKETKIETDANLKLIYINDLNQIFYKAISEECTGSSVYVKPNAESKVSDILARLKEFDRIYLQQNIIPRFTDYFDLSLFNTFRTYVKESHYPVQLNLHVDYRGNLLEIIKTNSPGQVFYSLTKPDITRGNHFHIRKIERFCVIQGKAVIKLRRVGTTNIIEYPVNGNNPAVVDIPVFYTHNITNVGKSDLLTFFWTNEFLNLDDADTYYEEV